MSKETPKAHIRTAAKPKITVGPAKGRIAKKKPKPKQIGKAKKSKISAAHQQRDSSTEFEIDQNAEGREGGDASAGQLVFEGDANFEDAFQASTRGPPQAPQRVRGARPPPFTMSDRNIHRDTPPDPPVSDSELLGESESSTMVTTSQQFHTAAAPQVSIPLAHPSQTAAAPQVSVPHAHPSQTAAPPPRQNVNAITGGPFAGPYRRREALSGYGDGPMRHPGSPVRSSWIPLVPGVHNLENGSGGMWVTRTSNAAAMGLPVAPMNWPPQSVYVPAPDGSHIHYHDASGPATYVSHPDPSTNTRIGFTPNQRAQSQAQNVALSSQVGQTAQPVSPPSHLDPPKRNLPLPILIRPDRSPTPPQSPQTTTSPTKTHASRTN